MESPQTSEIFSDETHSVSIRDKTLLNRSLSKNNNNNNFSSGYVPVENTKPSNGGRKTFAFWVLFGLLFIMAVGNLILTITILSILRLGQGIEGIELIPEEGTIKLFGNIDLDHIYKRDGVLEGYEDEPVQITSEEGQVQVKLYSRAGRSSTKLALAKNGTAFTGMSSFVVKNDKDEEIFTITDPIFTSFKHGKNLRTSAVHTNKIRSPSAENLKIHSDNVYLKGAEGTKIEGKRIVWSAAQEIHISSNGSLILSGQDGVFIDLTGIPIAQLNDKNYLAVQFKVCICIPGGKLFRVPVASTSEKVHCHHANIQHNNPCI